MKAPEKIYIPMSRHWYGIDSLFYPVRQYKNDIEYVRTDAFVKRACEWLKENANKYLYNTGEKGEYIPTCSGKIIDDFRNYMKGE